MGIAALVLWHLRDRFAPGVLFGLYLMLAGVERFLVEIIRRNDSVVAGLTQPQLVSLAMLGARRGDRDRAPRRPAAPPRVGTPLRAPPRAQSASATDAPAALPAWNETLDARRRRPPPPRAAPASIARAGVRACRRTATAGATSTASTSSAPRPCTATATAVASSASSASRTSGGRTPSAAAPAPSKAVAASGRWSAARASPPSASSSRGRDEVGVGHAERVAEEQLLEPLRRVRGEREQRAEAHQARDHHGGAGLRADALVARGERDQRRGHERPAGRAEQQRGAGQRGEHEPGQQPVRERLGGVGQPLDDDPEAERAAEGAEQRDLEQRAAVDAGAERIEQEVERSVPVSARVVVLDGHRAASAAVLEHDQLAAVGGLERRPVEHLGGRRRRPPGGRSGRARGRRRGRSPRRGWTRAACGPRRAARRTRRRSASRWPGRRRRAARRAAARRASCTSARASRARWRWPPESSPKRVRARVRQPHALERGLGRARVSPRARRAATSARARACPSAPRRAR